MVFLNLKSELDPMAALMDVLDVGREVMPPPPHVHIDHEHWSFVVSRTYEDDEFNEDAFDVVLTKHL